MSLEGITLARAVIERLFVRVYLDACCLSRPFDIQTQDRIKLEAAAVIRILEHIESGHHKLVTSEALEFEIARTASPKQRACLLDVLSLSSHKVTADAKVDSRARDLIRLGFKALDAYHVASAETGNADVLLTTDDRFIKCAARNNARIAVRIENPTTCLMELRP